MIYIVIGFVDFDIKFFLEIENLKVIFYCDFLR